MAPANTFTVTNTTEYEPGSLRRAILDANSTPGADVINFNIGSGPQTILNINEPLPRITDPVFIDGTTQLGFSGAPIIELRGGDFAGLTISAPGCIVQGLVINRYISGITLLGGGNNIIRGNYIGTDLSGTVAVGNGNGIQSENSSNNVIGGTDASARNVISGSSNIGVNIFRGQFNQVLGNYVGTNASGSAAIPNNNGVNVTEATNNIVGGSTPGSRNVVSGNSVGILISGSSDRAASSNRIEGNFIGINAAGTAALGNSALGIYVLTATNNTVGGVVTGARNIISGNGEGVRVTAGSGNFIQGNYIGADPTGTQAIANINHGIYIISASTTSIGGTTTGARNVISGNRLNGVNVYDSLGGSGNKIQGNYIGTQADGVSRLGNGAAGVGFINIARGNTVGGLDTGAGNVIAYNGTSGVANNVAGDAETLGNSVSGNSIFSNALLGIDQFGDGVSPNDPGDNISAGPQNFPVLTSAQELSRGTEIVGTLNSRSNSTFRIEFFSNSTCDPSGYGEGQRYLGTTTVSTDNNGDAQIHTTVVPNDTAGLFITATATSASNFSSEFSACVRAADRVPPPPPVLLTEPNSNRAIAFDSLIMLRDPFPVVTSSVLSPDHRTRIAVFALNVDPNSNRIASLTAQAEDSNGIHPLAIEYVGKVPGFDWLTQIVVKLPDELSQNADVNVSISFLGMPSNKVLVGIRAP